MGTLVIAVMGVVHKIGQVISRNRTAVAQVVCRQIGFESGVLILGPQFGPYGGGLSRLTAWCNGTEETILACSEIDAYVPKSKLMVDYFICIVAPECTSTARPIYTVVLQSKPSQLPYYLSNKSEICSVSCRLLRLSPNSRSFP